MIVKKNVSQCSKLLTGFEWWWWTWILIHTVPLAQRKNNKKPASAAPCIFVTHDECWNETSWYLACPLNARFDTFVGFHCFYVSVWICYIMYAFMKFIVNYIIKLLIWSSVFPWGSMWIIWGKWFKIVK